MPRALRRSLEVGGLGQSEGRGDFRVERRGMYLVGLRVACFSVQDAKVFPGFDFNFQVPIEGEAKKSDSDDEADPWCFQMPPAPFLSPVNLRLRLLQRPALLPRSLGLHILTYMVWKFR